MSRSAPAARPVAAIVSVVVAVALFSGCATRSMSASESPTPVESPSPSMSTSALPTELPSVTPMPTPTPSQVGEETTVLFVTLDVVSGTLEASGILPEVVEEGGECTLSLTQGETTRTVIGGTAVGPESTYCGLLTVPVAELASGDWQVTLEYRSANHTGRSDVETVSAP